MRPIVIPGTTPVILVAPHGGCRDPDRPLPLAHPRKVNDLHTAALTETLARATGAAALINDDVDRNAVDLNRISEAHDGAPAFLDALGDLILAARSRHGRATVLTVHGWNVGQPTVDVGLGVRPGPTPLTVGDDAAVSPAFASSSLPALLGALAAEGIGVSIGARYPARGRENLLQLFTPRYRDDPRPVVRALAALGPITDAVQLELGIPLRWEGKWRERLVRALLAALPALAAPAPIMSDPAAVPSVDLPSTPQTLEFVTPLGAGLARIDAGGSRLLLLPPEGGLLLFTGERSAAASPHGLGVLAVRHSPHGAAWRFTGPMLRFPDTEPFLDLELGLARATLVEAELALEFAPLRGTEPRFGHVRGQVIVDGAAMPLEGPAYAGATTRGAPAMFHTAVRLGDDRALALALRPGGEVVGILVEGHRSVAVTSARRIPVEGPPDAIHVTVGLADGREVEVRGEVASIVPIIRRQGGPPLRVLLSTIQVPGVEGLAGWSEQVELLAPLP